MEGLLPRIGSASDTSAQTATQNSSVTAVRHLPFNTGWAMGDEADEDLEADIGDLEEADNQAEGEEDSEDEAADSAVFANPTAAPMADEGVEESARSNAVLTAQDLGAVDDEDEIEIVANLLAGEFELVGDGDALSSAWTLDWATPTLGRIDEQTIDFLSRQCFVPIHLVEDFGPRVLCRDGSSRPAYKFRQRELAMLSRDTWLNDECLNGLAEMIHLSAWFGFWTAQQCAIFLTHDLLMANYNPTDGEFWKRVKRTEFWLRKIWIVPIHRPHQRHWVLAIVYPYERRIVLYDSLAGKSHWDSDIKVSINSTLSQQLQD